MTRLTDAGVVDIIWGEEDDGTITAKGLQEYEIELQGEHGLPELAVLRCSRGRSA